MAYKKTEEFEPEVTGKLMEHYTEVIRLLGENPQREG